MIHYPQVGIPLVILLIAGFLMSNAAGASSWGDSSSLGGWQSVEIPRTPTGTTILKDLKRLKEEDPNFSLPLFRDFAILLYTRGAIARGTGQTEEVSPYIEAKVLQIWRGMVRGAARLEGLDNVIVGNLQIERIEGFGAAHRTIRVLFETNLTERTSTGEKTWYEKTWYMRERWTFQRKSGILSKEPERMKSLGCPACGATGELQSGTRCTFCDTIIEAGEHHWSVRDAQVIDRRPWEPPEISSGSGEEIGTNHPTIYDPRLESEKRALQTRYPGFEINEFMARARSLFLALQEAWTSGQWEKARAYETDCLFNSHRYWIENYTRAGLRNHVEAVKIKQIHLVKIEPDAFYEAITIRIFASALDYTMDSQGRQRDGSKDQPRSFSEYWTFIRTAGGNVDKTRGDADGCPSCGAPIKVSAAGVCEYCDSLVTTGSFDWVLSSIEQDEVYSG